MTKPEVIFTTGTGDGHEVEVGYMPDTLELTVNGKRVVVRDRLDLTFWQKVGGVIAVVSAALGGFYAFLQTLDWFHGA